MAIHWIGNDPLVLIPSLQIHSIHGPSLQRLFSLHQNDPRSDRTRPSGGEKLNQLQRTTTHPLRNLHVGVQPQISQLKIF